MIVRKIVHCIFAGTRFCCSKNAKCCKFFLNRQPPVRCEVYDRVYKENPLQRVHSCGRRLAGISETPEHSGRKGERMSEFLFTVLVFAVFITAMFLLYNNVCVVKKYKVETDKLCGSFKIVLVSDFHNSRRLYRSVVRKIKSCEPDVIIISGDLVDRRKPDFDTARKFLGALRSFASVE